MSALLALGANDLIATNRCSVAADRPRNTQHRAKTTFARPVWTRAAVGGLCLRAVGLGRRCLVLTAQHSSCCAVLRGRTAVQRAAYFGHR
eukprot:2389484-Rhodomonas_salina.2